MEKRLAGIQNTVLRIDDILITGNDDEEHLTNLRAVLQVMKDNGLKLKGLKCSFMVDEVIYLGFKINKEGVSTVDEKVKPILEAPAPKDVHQLKSFLGMLQYYHRHLPNLASTLEPLHNQLRKNQKWTWGTEQQVAFEKAKARLGGAELLVHYNPNLPMRLAVDASAYGVGAVLSHVMPDGIEKPVAYASRTLSQAERNYAPTEREGLAVVFGVKKFHQYLFGLKFTIQTDHKPLLGLLGMEKSISALSAARLQRWALLLSAYNYMLVYKYGRDHANADGMSRLPVSHKDVDVSNVENNIYMVDLDRSPVTAKETKLHTDRDIVLSRVRDFVKDQWPEDLEVDEGLKPYKERELELTVELDVVLWGGRVIIPVNLRPKILEELHLAHAGMSRMKMLARAYCWWPGMDKEIENMVRNCDVCLEVAQSPHKTLLHPWEKAEKPWSRIHVDHAGPFMGHTFFLVADSYTKWIDAYPVSSTSTELVVEKLRQSFSIQGLPEVIVSDNATCFTSQEFANFVKKNGFRHITSAPYHPASNGLAERAVQTFKRTLSKISKTSKESINTQVNRFLFAYRNTPSAVTGVSPAELLFKHRPKTRLSDIKPSLGKVLQKSTDDMIQKNSQQTKEFGIGDNVMARSYRGGENWLKGVVSEKLGEVMYKVQIGGGWIRRHVDQMRKDSRIIPAAGVEAVIEVEPVTELQQEVDQTVLPSVVVPTNVSAPSEPKMTSESSSSVPVVVPTAIRRSQRDRKVPSRLTYQC